MDDLLERMSRAIERERATVERDIPDVRVQSVSAMALARAALGAMLEPTPGQLDAGNINLVCRRDCTLGSVRAQQVWQAMIDAALSAA